MDNETRRHFTPEQKVAILRQHLLEQVPISDLCDKHQINATMFYRWQKEFFENGAAAFAKPLRSRGLDRHHQTIARLEEKLKIKDEVIAGASRHCPRFSGGSTVPPTDDCAELQ
jgi:transposase-like protein